MKILFLTHPYPNYVPDLLLHGLRKLFGPDVVDFPRKTCLYNSVLGLGVCPDDQRCPGWFPDDQGEIDRVDIWAKVKGGFFDFLICDLRALGLLSDELQQWPEHCIIIDGEDKPQPIIPGPYVLCRRETDGSDYCIPLPMALPEEIFNWIISYDHLPKRYSIGFLGSTHDDMRKQLVTSLIRYYPDALFQATAVPSQDQPVPQGRMGRDTYYQHLQQCQMVLSLAGAGYDTFRFWENAACHAVHLSAEHPLFIPNDFYSGEEIVRFRTVDQLRKKIDKLFNSDDATKTMIYKGRKKLTDCHLTTQRAKYFLDRVTRVFNITIRN